MAKIKPELPSGFRDYLPEDMIPRQKMLDVIRNVFERFGFEPLDTSMVEKFSVLTGNDPDFKMNLFRTGIVKGANQPLAQAFEEMALRFDLTVPLARVVATNLDLPWPFKRYQMGYVFRGEKAQRGRFRGFMQFDADTVGSATMLADTEIIQLMYTTMRALGVKNFVIRFNNRKILNGLAKLAGFDKPEKRKEVFRILDKMEKSSWEELKTELQKKPENKFDATAPNLSDNSIEIIENFLKLTDEKFSSEQVLSILKGMFKNTPIGLEGINELTEIVNNLQGLNIPKENWKNDLSVARGLDYYTGPVFETTLTDLPEIGSVFSGGRYDDLVSRFSDATLPATGASLGVDRLFVALEILKVIKKQKSVCQAIILNLDLKLQADYLQIAQELRSAKIKTQIYMGEDLSFRAQLAYALKMEIPIVLILGENEKKKNIIEVKDTRTREQKPVAREKVTEYIKNLLR
ncbi:histidine--tRNA ligase [Patescibacteria group bacterium]|nr:histidine--tRNA ligase [Patescibacteria group bacterium]